MLKIFSPREKVRTWRRLWIALAETEMELGLPITEDQVDELKENADNINFAQAEEFEAAMHHDVMAHIATYRRQCPKAGPIIHLGATSCYVTDNADLIMMRHAMDRLLDLMKDLNWLDVERAELRYRYENLPFLGCKGATGTQASFMKLFDNDEEKVIMLDQVICEKMGFNSLLTISGQTYTRKIDTKILSVLASIATEVANYAQDVRYMQSCRKIISNYNVSLQVAANQWLERSLDDSASKRIIIPESFIALELILKRVKDGLRTKKHDQVPKSGDQQT